MHIKNQNNIEKMGNVKKKEFAPEYRSPKAKVIEVKVQGILCSSQDENESPGEEIIDLD